MAQFASAATTLKPCTGANVERAGNSCDNRGSHSVQFKGTMFGMDRSKTQGEPIPSAKLPADVIVSPTRAADGFRPVSPVQEMAGSGCQRTAVARLYRLAVPNSAGLVGKEVEWTWDEFARLAARPGFLDFHCVTRWSRLGNLWEGVSTRALIELAGGARPEARFVLVRGSDRGWTTNLPLDHFLAEDALVAILHDGEPIHGRAWRAGPPDRAAALRLEERQMDRRDRVDGEGSPGLLGSQRLSHARRSVAGRAPQLVAGRRAGRHRSRS